MARIDDVKVGQAYPTGHGSGFYWVDDVEIRKSQRRVYGKAGLQPHRERVVVCRRVWFGADEGEYNETRVVVRARELGGLMGHADETPEALHARMHALVIERKEAKADRERRIEHIVNGPLKGIVRTADFRNGAVQLRINLEDLEAWVGGTAVSLFDMIRDKQKG